VLLISYNAPFQYDTCTHIVIDTTGAGIFAQLIIFKDGEANLFDYCNDYGNGIIPIKALTKATGDFYIKFSAPTQFRGTANPTASIFIRQLVFTDTSINRSIEIKNELFWKVYQLGPAG